MCKLCGMTGADITRIKNHIESMHWQPQLRTTYSCEICGASCKTKHGLACHKSRHHSKKKMMLQQQASYAASINQNGAGGVNLSTLAAAAAVQPHTAIITPNQSVATKQTSGLSADSVALAALAAVKEPIPLQTNLARVGASMSNATNTIRFNQPGAATMMSGGGIANPAAAYMQPIGGAIITTLPLNPQPGIQPQTLAQQPPRKGYATVSKPSTTQSKGSTTTKNNKVVDALEGNQIKIEDKQLTPTIIKEIPELEPFGKKESSRRKIGENPFVDEEVSNSPVPDPTPSETSRKSTPQKKPSKRKSEPIITEEPQTNQRNNAEQSEKHSKVSPGKSKPQPSTKAPKRTPTRSKRGRKRY